jgi:myo-inositol-1-phosphate synthase
MKSNDGIRQAKGRLGVLLPGMGAVATTTIAGAMLARRGLAKPVGSLTQLGALNLRADDPTSARPLREVLPLATLDDLTFGGWDIFPDDAHAAAVHAEVLSSEHLAQVRDELAAVRPMAGAFYPNYVRRLSGTHVKTATSKADMVEQLRDDIRRFMREQRCDRAVAVWCGSTEVFQPQAPVHASIAAFEEGLRKDAPEISNSQLYAWACLKERVPFANGSPNLAVDFPAAYDLAREMRVPIAGKDFKTGQTLLKTVIAPALRARMLGLRGWYSTNMLGNRDGEVLDDPDSFRTKETSKLGVLETILRKDQHPDLYGGFFHKVRIDYYPPRGDAKEGWDNIDLFGWLGYPMQLKLNFLCRDSILAAPIVLDLALWLDLAQRADRHGVQDWLGFYFKAPTTPSGAPEHDLFAQQATLEATLRALAGRAAETQ